MANELKKRGVTISPAGVRCVWLRHDFGEHQKRTENLAAKSLHEGLILTEAHGEFQSECPEYSGAQDTFYVGTLKGVGRIYQQTFIDTSARWPWPSSLTQDSDYSCGFAQ